MLIIRAVNNRTMEIKEVTLEQAKNLTLKDHEEIEQNYKAIYVIETGNKYQAKAWFYEDNDNWFYTCYINGISQDSDNKQDAIDFIINAIT